MQVMNYIDKCWMYPDYIRLAWIDARGLDTPDFLSTTGRHLPSSLDRSPLLHAPLHRSPLSAGISEGSHSYYTKFLMNSTVNRLVSESIVTTTGVCADGSIRSGFFRDAETRWGDAEGKSLPKSTDREVRHAKACVAFLTLGRNCIYPHRLELLSVEEFGAILDAEADACEDDSARAWRRHRRESGGRMSSIFTAVPLRPPSDAELTALVFDTCLQIRQQVLDADQPEEDRPGITSSVRLA